MIHGMIIHFIIGGLVGGLITGIVLTGMEFIKTRKRNKYYKSLNSTILKEMFDNNESLIKIIKANDKKLAGYK